MFNNIKDKYVLEQGFLININSDPIKKDINKEQYDEKSDLNNEIKDLNKKEKTQSKRKRNGIGKLIREYVLLQEKFTTDEIIKQFPEAGKWNVYNAVKILKEEGTVKKITQREYEVIK